MKPLLDHLNIVIMIMISSFVPGSNGPQLFTIEQWGTPDKLPRAHTWYVTTERARTHTHTHPRTPTHTHAHTRTHAHTHTHTHAQALTGTGKTTL